MAELGTLLSGIRTVIAVIDKVLPKKGTKIENKILAVSTMQKAINHTEAYLVKSDRNFVPNENLADLWMEAFTVMIKIDKNLASRLRQKSMFWSNPQRWLQEDTAMELIPDLQELNEKCEMILIELERRK